MTLMVGLLECMPNFQVKQNITKAGAPQLIDFAYISTKQAKATKLSTLPPKKLLIYTNLKLTRYQLLQQVKQLVKNTVLIHFIGSCHNIQNHLLIDI